MLLQEYLTHLHNAIAECAQTGLIVSSELHSDLRTDTIGYLKGTVSFVDGSMLFFKEYLDLRYRLDKKMYAFHYQDAQTTLRFRYDNAAHKPDLGFQEHKHTPDGTIPAPIPTLQDVLAEIVQTYLAES